jgi:general secretion pathway protein A
MIEMYSAFFGLSKAPFGMTPDPSMLFVTEQHREAIAALTYSIMNRKGFIVLSGEAGTGKTTILNKALQFIPARSISLSLILNPVMTSTEFLEMVLLDFGISDVPASKAQRLAKLHDLLIRNVQESRVTLLAVDEAHALSPALLEELRLLSNFERSDQKLLQIALLGQPELAALLNREELRQLKQRIAVRLSIRPLLANEVRDYMRCRWRKAGGEDVLPFEDAAIAEIAAISRGIPRLVNCICDNALVLAFGQRRKMVTGKDVADATADLDLQRPLATSPAASGARSIFNGIPSPGDVNMLRTLERYSGPATERRGFLSRWTGRLGLSHTGGRA